MQVTEQVDAIRSMGADPIRKLVLPRVVATTISLPLLTILADVLGILGAMGIARIESGVGMRLFLESTFSSVSLEDFFHGLVKTIFFGFLLGVIACYKGLSCSGGTAGVGQATTETVVITSLVTLLCDFILTNLLLGFGL
jgi:phospholipid/cholesterol/gamma-HCH transport system permease protein